MVRLPIGYGQRRREPLAHKRIWLLQHCLGWLRSFEWTKCCALGLPLPPVLEVRWMQPAGTGSAQTGWEAALGFVCYLFAHLVDQFLNFGVLPLLLVHFNSCLIQSPPLSFTTLSCVLFPHPTPLSASLFIPLCLFCLLWLACSLSLSCPLCHFYLLCFWYSWFWNQPLSFQQNLLAFISHSL